MMRKPISINPATGRRVIWLNYILEFNVALLILIFMHTGISKLIEQDSFSQQLSINPVFQHNHVFYSYAGPILEIIIAMALAFKRTRFIGLVASFFLMSFFTGYVIYLMVAMPTLPCSCGGVIAWLSWPQHLVLNVFLTIVSLVSAYFWRRMQRLRK